jgi:mRNA-degrading endonuclease RelE of RelBE toxin-antitoxin system
MVDRINKVLRKMSAKERKQILGVLEEIKSGRISLLDLKKMQGNEHTYRVRKGAFRIIFHMTNRDTIRIIDLERRTDTTYNDF